MYELVRHVLLVRWGVRVSFCPKFLVSGAGRSATPVMTPIIVTE